MLGVHVKKMVIIPAREPSSPVGPNMGNTILGLARRQQNSRKGNDKLFPSTWNWVHLTMGNTTKHPKQNKQKAKQNKTKQTKQNKTKQTKLTKQQKNKTKQNKTNQKKNKPNKKQNQTKQNKPKKKTNQTKKQTNHFFAGSCLDVPCGTIQEDSCQELAFVVMEKISTEGISMDFVFKEMCQEVVLEEPLQVDRQVPVLVKKDRAYFQIQKIVFHFSILLQQLYHHWVQ